MFAFSVAEIIPCKPFKLNPYGHRVVYWKCHALVDVALPPLRARARGVSVARHTLASPIRDTWCTLCSLASPDTHNLHLSTHLCKILDRFCTVTPWYLHLNYIRSGTYIFMYSQQNTLLSKVAPNMQQLRSLDDCKAAFVLVPHVGPPALNGNISGASFFCTCKILHFVNYFVSLVNSIHVVVNTGAAGDQPPMSGTMFRYCART